MYYAHTRPTDDPTPARFISGVSRLAISSKMRLSFVRQGLSSLRSGRCAPYAPLREPLTASTSSTPLVVEADATHRR